MRAATVLIVLVSTGLFAQSALQGAADLARRGRYAEARKAMEGAPEPTDLKQRIAFHRLRAAIASGLHEPLPAVTEMHAALALAPADPGLLLATAVAELQAGDVSDALAHAQAAPESATREALIGDIEEKRGDSVGAARAYRAAVELAPGHEQYRIALGLELIEHQDFQAAGDTLRNALAAFPKSAKLRTLAGVAEYAQGYSHEAVRSLEEAIDVDPSFEPAYGALAQIVLQSSAAPSPNTVQRLCSWNRFACSAVRLRLARETGNRVLETEAIAVLKSAPADSAIGHCELGRAYEWNANLQQARTEMEKCVSLQPTPQNLYRLGLLYKRLGLTTLAEEQLNRRKQILQKMSEQTALGMNALAGFER